MHAVSYASRGGGERGDVQAVHALSCIWGRGFRLCMLCLMLLGEGGKGVMFRLCIPCLGEGGREGRGDVG